MAFPSTMTRVSKTMFRPLHDRVLVKRLEETDERHGSILVPDTAKEPPQTGRVVAVGPGRMTDDGKHLPLSVKAGYRVLFSKDSGSEITLDGEELLVMREEDILGIVGG